MSNFATYFVTASDNTQETKFINLEKTMKTGIIKIFTLAVMLFSASNANAQYSLSDILGKVFGNNSAAISGLTSIFSSDKQATAENIIGTWTYDSPAVVFDSDDLLSKAGAAYAGKKLEARIQEALTKYGIVKGGFSITFKKDGTFTETIKGKTYTGKWQIQARKLVLTYSYKTMSITTQKDGTRLLFVTNASKLLNLMQSLGAKTATSSALSNITALTKNIKGMQVGLALTKK